MDRKLASNCSREFVWLLAGLVVASILATGLLAIRIVWSRELTHAFLVWNLFLAWMPLFFSLLAFGYRECRWKFLGFSALWLLFLPNAPYLVTDLVHLRVRPPVPLWFDMVLLQSFIWLGLLLGFISLYKMQWIVRQRFGIKASWVFVAIVVILTGFGIYLGRVQRWNSWDIVTNPVALFIDIFRHFTPPYIRLAASFTILYGAFFFVAYLMFYGLTHLRFAFVHAGPGSAYDPQSGAAAAR